MRWMILVALLSGPAMAYADPADSGPPSSVLVATFKLTPGSLPASVTAYGSITPGPGSELALNLPSAGIIAAVDVTQGQRVEAGQSLMTITPDPQSVADLKKAVSAVRAAAANRAHVAALLASHLATTADLAAADQMAGDAASVLAALRATGAGTARPITAPFAGVVSAVLATPGALQAAGTPLLKLANTRSLVAALGVPPAQIAQINPGAAADVTLLNSGAEIAGHVQQASNLLDTQTGLGAVLVALDPSAKAMLGEPARASIITGLLSGYVVPRNAVLNDEQGDYVFQVDGKNIARRSGVHVLGSQGDRTVIAADINPAMPVVTTGAYQLDDGTAVRTQN